MSYPCDRQHGTNNKEQRHRGESKTAMKATTALNLRPLLLFQMLLLRTQGDLGNNILRLLACLMRHVCFRDPSGPFQFIHDFLFCNWNTLSY